MTNWNYADVWEMVADLLGDETALVMGERRYSWRAFERRSDRIAHWLLELGVEQKDKVALYLYNTPEYLEGFFASTKIGLVPVNTSYRYEAAELIYLWDNADAVAVIFHGVFTERIEKIRAKLPRIRGWLWVDDETGPCPDWAVPCEDVAEGDAEAAKAPWGRSGDDIVMLYTGGTTGYPKGVMWRQDDLFARLNSGGFRRYPQDQGLTGIRQDIETNGRGMILLPACPLMHGTGLFTAIETLAAGGTVVLFDRRRFDADRLLDTVEREKVSGLVIVGDPFARPIVATLEANPERWNLSSLIGILSSGAMWSEEVKKGLSRFVPNALLVDVFSSSEAIGLGTSVSSSGSSRHTAEFTLGDEVKVLTSDGRQVTPGSGEVGMLALGGRNPIGYYKDEAKTDATFREVDGVRYSIPGDFAEVKEEGSIHLLGRGSVCINTAGEKVFPEEVEEALKTFPSVRDAIVIGVPDERFGEQIVAAVELSLGEDDIAEAVLISHVKEQLASYKAPRRVRVVGTIGRSPSGKVDYQHHRKEATEWVRSQSG